MMIFKTTLAKIEYKFNSIRSHQTKIRMMNM